MLKELAVSLKFGGKILNIIYKLIKCLATLKEFYAGHQRKPCYISQFFILRRLLKIYLICTFKS